MFTIIRFGFYNEYFFICYFSLQLRLQIQLSNRWSDPPTSSTRWFLKFCDSIWRFRISSRTTSSSLSRTTTTPLTSTLTSATSRLILIRWQYFNCLIVRIVFISKLYASRWRCIIFLFYFINTWMFWKIIHFRKANRII